MVKRGRKKMKGGAILPAVIGGVTLANQALKQVKPATKATEWLKSQGYETDPSKLSGVKWLSATALKGMRDLLGWGMGQSGNVLYGQSGGSMIEGSSYGVPALMKVRPQVLTQVSGSGKRRKTIKV